MVSLRPAATELTSAYPPQHLCIVPSLGLIGLTGVLVCPFFWIIATFVKHQAWYTGSSNSNVKVRVCSPDDAGQDSKLPETMQRTVVMSIWLIRFLIATKLPVVQATTLHLPELCLAFACYSVTQAYCRIKLHANLMDCFTCHPSI